VRTVPTQANRRIARFGAFEADLQTGELRKSGLRIKIQEQPFQVLVALLENPGELISREELHKRLWPATSFMDFDHGLNLAVKKLRAALDDSPGTPRYIETLARRGYRFIAHVEFQSLPSNVQQQTIPASKNGRRNVMWIATAGVGITALAISALLLAPGHAAPTISVITSYDGEVWAPQVAPDDSRIAFFWSQEVRRPPPGGLYEKEIGSESPLQLAGPQDGVTAFAWSPDGTQIAVLKEDSAGGEEICLIPALGGEIRKLASLPQVLPSDPFLAWRGNLAWSPDGSLLAFSGRSSPHEPFGIMLLDIRTLQVKPLTHPAPDELGDSDPSFSRDGTWLAFNRMHDGVVMDIYRVPLARGSPVRLTFDNTFISGLSITSDGRAIVFASDRGGPSNETNLFQIPAAGGEPSLLFMSGEAIRRPFTLHKGRRIAYVQDRPNGTVWRYRLSPDHVARNPVKVASSSRNQIGARISPDGSRILFDSDRVGRWNLWVANRDGAEPKQITFMNDPGSPTWSPDGKQIAFDHFDGPHSDIYVMDSSGGPPRRVTDGRSNNYVPYWSHDGEWLYFASLRSGHQEVWKLSLSDGHMAQVTRHGVLYVSQEAPDGRWIYFWRAGAIWRAPTQGGEDEFVTKCSEMAAWALGKEGLYLYERTDGGAIRYFDFKRQRFSTVLAPAMTPMWGWSISVSRAEDTLLYVAQERVGSEIRIIDLH
jgi:Tol biopolymer transport system component/DNA-binding winged helix-turn-helix (wHTH) protein